MGHRGVERLAAALEQRVQVFGLGGVLDDAHAAATALAYFKLVPERCPQQAGPPKPVLGAVEVLGRPVEQAELGGSARRGRRGHEARAELGARGEHAVVADPR